MWFKLIYLLVSLYYSTNYHARWLDYKISQAFIWYSSFLLNPSTICFLLRHFFSVIKQSYAISRIVCCFCSFHYQRHSQISWFADSTVRKFGFLLIFTFSKSVLLKFRVEVQHTTGLQQFFTLLVLIILSLFDRICPYAHALLTSTSFVISSFIAIGPHVSLYLRLVGAMVSQDDPRKTPSSRWSSLNLICVR